MTELLPPLLLTGGPAVGKTVTARALAETTYRCAHLDVDDIRQLIKNGGAAPWAGAEGAAQQRLGVRNTAALARNFGAAGFTVTITDVVTAQTLDLYRELLPGLIAVRLAVSFAEACRRARLRPMYLTDQEFEALHRAQAGVLAVDHQLDVTDLDRAAQVLQVRTLWQITQAAGSCRRLPAGRATLPPVGLDAATARTRVRRDAYGRRRAGAIRVSSPQRTRNTGWVQLISQDGASVELWPVRYQFGATGVRGDWDANWLVIHGGIHTATGESWTFDDPCLTTWEAQEFGVWLRATAEGRAPDGMLSFTEPNLGFSVARDEDPVDLRVHLSLESLSVAEPPEDFYVYSVPLRVPRQNLLIAAHAWQEALAQFPVR